MSRKPAATRGQQIQAKLDQAIALQQGGAFELAQLLYEDVLKLQPGHAHAMNLLGVLASQKSEPGRGLEWIDKAIRIAPTNPVFHANRGLVLKELLQFGAAIASFDKAVALKPDYALAHWNKSMLLLLTGQFEIGWELYEWRWKCVREPRKADAPLWLGAETIEGRTLLLHGEQGLGDSIQFSRYATLLAQRGARVLLEVPASLVGLLQTLDGPVQVLASGAQLPAFDAHCPLMSLPFACKTALATIPSRDAYLHCDDAKLIAWSRRLGPKTKPRVGLAWSGSAQNRHDGQRSVPLATIVAHLRADCEYVSLQKDLRDSDKALLRHHPEIRHFGAEQQDFADAAALCCLVDVIVSVDTSLAHLSGALGRPTWVLLAQCPDWRWLLDRDDSPWYPSAKLLRQTTAGDWAGVLARVHADLAQLAV